MISLVYKSAVTLFHHFYFKPGRLAQYRHGNIIALLILAAALSGCNNSITPEQQVIKRSTNDLRIITDGDYIEYTVTGTKTEPALERDATNNRINLTGNGSCRPKEVSSEESFTGTLRIDWSANPPLTEPLSGSTTVDVMKQVTTLTLEGSSPVTTTEYISQDKSGSISLYAFDDNPGMSQYNWVSTASRTQIVLDADGNSVLDSNNNVVTEDVANLGSIVSPVVLPSPLPSSGSSNGVYYVNQGCEGSSACTESIRRFTNNLTFLGENPGGLNTALGKFNPLGYLFTDALQDTSSTSVEAMLDIRGFCDMRESFFKGVAWVLPEVGLVELTNTCASNDIQEVDMSDTTVVNPSESCTVDPQNSTVPVFLITQWSLTAEISKTNIPLPSY
jgi:hypothetical protein